MVLAVRGATDLQLRTVVRKREREREGFHRGRGVSKGKGFSQGGGSARGNVSERLHRGGGWGVMAAANVNKNNTAGPGKQRKSDLCSWHSPRTRSPRRNSGAGQRCPCRSLACAGPSIRSRRPSAHQSCIPGPAESNRQAKQQSQFKARLVRALHPPPPSAQSTRGGRKREEEEEGGGERVEAAKTVQRVALRTMTALTI